MNSAWDYRIRILGRQHFNRQREQKCLTISTKNKNDKVFPFICLVSSNIFHCFVGNVIAYGCQSSSDRLSKGCFQAEFLVPSQDAVMRRIGWKKSPITTDFETRPQNKSWTPCHQHQDLWGISIWIISNSYQYPDLTTKKSVGYCVFLNHRLHSSWVCN